MTTLEVYPGLVAACSRKYTAPQGRAKKARRFTPIMGLALWHLARHIDPAGRGRVHLVDLQRAGVEMWGKATYYRALRDAEQVGLVRQTQRQRDGAPMVACTGLAKVAELFQLPNVGARKVSIPLDSLISSKKFKSALWSAWHAGRSCKTGAPITRQTMREMSGMPESTQRCYEHAACDDSGARVTAAAPNAVVLAEGTPAELVGPLVAARDHLHGGCYVDRAAGLLLRPIGNSYSSSLLAGSRSRARKINRRSKSWCPTAAGQTFKRLFFADPRKAEQAARHGRADDVPLASTGRRAGPVALWRPVWDSWSLTHVAGV